MPVRAGPARCGAQGALGRADPLVPAVPLTPDSAPLGADTPSPPLPWGSSSPVPEAGLRAGVGTGALSAPVAWRAARGHCHPSSVPWGPPAVSQLHMPVTFPAGGRTPAAAPAAPCEVRAPGHGTSWHWDHHGSPCAAQEELLVPLPSAMMSLGTATCPHPAAAVAWECPAATEPGPASRPPRLLVPEQAFAAQQVLGWALGIPGTAQDSPHCQHPAHSGAVAAPATPCHNVPAPAAAAASARGSALAPEGLSKALGTPGLGGQQGVGSRGCSHSPARCQ